MATISIYKNNIATIITIVVMLLLCISCSKYEEKKIESISDRSALPKLRASDISTLISDSGITRYHINTPQWDVYDKASQPYWEFTMGIHVEQFDDDLKVESNIQSDYAKFLNNEELWELRGNVKMTNIKGELFESELLYWSQRDEKIYSDSIVKITRAEGIIEALEFESNQQLTKYHFKKANGVLPIEDD